MLPCRVLDGDGGITSFSLCWCFLNPQSHFLQVIQSQREPWAGYQRPLNALLFPVSGIWEWDCLTCSVAILSQRRRANPTLDWFEEMASFIMTYLTEHFLTFLFSSVLFLLLSFLFLSFTILPPSLFASSSQAHTVILLGLVSKVCYFPFIFCTETPFHCSIKVYLCFSFLYLPLKFVMVLLPITLGLLVTVFAEKILSTVAMILCFVLSKNKRKITSIEISGLHH